MAKLRPNTERIIKEDIEQIKAYEKAYGVKMPYVDEDGNVQGLPDSYPREVNGVVRSGYRLSDLGRGAVETGNPIQNPILGRNSSEETFKETMADYLTFEMDMVLHDREYLFNNGGDISE